MILFIDTDFTKLLCICEVIKPFLQGWDLMSLSFYGDLNFTMVTTNSNVRPVVKSWSYY